MLKKSTLSLLSCALLSSAVLSVSPVTASAKVKNSHIGNVQNSLSQGDNLPTPYTYEYEGVLFSYPTELSQSQLEQMYEVTMDPEEYAISSPTFNSSPLLKSTKINVGVTPNVVVLPPGGAQVTSGPFYRTYSNMESRLLITAATTFVGGVLSITASTAKWLVTGALSAGTFGATEIIGPTYVGAWNYKAYDSTQGRYRTYSTVVHYKYGNYTSPIKVQTYPLT